MSQPLISPLDWIRYAAERKGLKLEDLDVGDVLVLTPIRRIYEALLNYFKPKPWDRWIYEPSRRWGFHRIELDGIKVSFTITGVGPSEVAFVEEAILLGLKHIVFIGYAGGLGDVDVGDVVLPYEGICEDGYSQHYIPYGIAVDTDRRLIEVMAKILETLKLNVKIARVWSLPTPYRELEFKAREYSSRWCCRAVEMETCAIYALAKYYNVKAIAILIVSDIVFPKERKMLGFHSQKLIETVNKIPRAIEEYIKRIR